MLCQKGLSLKFKLKSKRCLWKIVFFKPRNLIRKCISKKTLDTRFFWIICFWYVFSIIAELKFGEPKSSQKGREIRDWTESLCWILIYKEKSCAFVYREGMDTRMSPFLLFHTSFFVSNPVFHMDQVRYQQWIIRFSQSVSGCFRVLRSADSLSPFPHCNSMILLPPASTSLNSPWGSSKSKLKLQ